MRTCVCLYVQAWETVVVCMCLAAWSYAAHVRHYADILQPLAFTSPGLYTPHQCYELLRVLCYSSLSCAYEVIQHVLCLLLSLCCVFSVPACINVSLPPHWPLIYESYPGLSLLPPEGSIDGPICRVCQQENRLMSTNIMNILLTTCGLQHLRFR